MQIIGFVEEASSTQFDFWVQGRTPDRGSLVMTHCYADAKAFGVVVGTRTERSGLIRQASVDPHLTEEVIRELNGHLGSLVEARVVGRQIRGQIEYQLPRLPAEIGQDVLICEEEDIWKFLAADEAGKYPWIRHLLDESIEVISESVKALGAALKTEERKEFAIRAGLKIAGLGSWSYQSLEAMARTLGTTW